MSAKPYHQEDGQHGNILLIILLAIVLIGALGVAIQGGGKQNATIDHEKMVMRIAEVQRYAAELERAVNYILRNGKSEGDLRFAHPDAPKDYGDLEADTDQSDQVFAKAGGGANYRNPPADVNDGSAWEFYGDTILPEVGSDAPELVAVLPNVNEAFCKAFNETIGYEKGSQPMDLGDCLKANDSQRFGDDVQFSNSLNTVENDSFSRKPAMQGCVKCADGKFHVFHVLLAR